MTDEQINDLAQEYAKAVTPFSADEFYYELAFHRNEKEFCKAIKWLSERFCIVEKEKVKEAYTKAMNAEQWGDRGDDNLYGGYVLETLFPELFKDEEK